MNDVETARHGQEHKEIPRGASRDGGEKNEREENGAKVVQAVMFSLLFGHHPETSKRTPRGVGPHQYL